MKEQIKTARFQQEERRRVICKKRLIKGKILSVKKDGRVAFPQREREDFNWRERRLELESVGRKQGLIIIKKLS